MKRAALVSAAAAVLALSACESQRGTQQSGMAPPASAAPAAATLGAQLTSQVNPSARGDANVMVDRGSKTARWTVNYSGLSGPATMAHFHGPAAPGQNAPPVIWLSPQGQPVPAGRIEGQAQLTDQQMTDLMAGRYYVNVHTAANPNGEIRGQVTPRGG